MVCLAALLRKGSLWSESLRGMAENIRFPPEYMEYRIHGGVPCAHHAKCFHICSIFTDKKSKPKGGYINFQVICKFL